MKPSTPYSTISFVLWLLLIVSSGIPRTLYSQSLPSCTSNASDSDGDGFGWENDRSCRVDTSSPEVINPSNGAQIVLVRPYWNAARDIENRTIQCDRYYYSEQQSSFVYSANTLYETQLATTANGIQYFHHPLPVGQPSIAYAQPITHTGKRFSFWSVDSGIYIGAALFGGDSLEIIDRNGVNAVRRWHSMTSSTQAYYDECFDISGAAFEPTGNEGESAPVYPFEDSQLVISDYAEDHNLPSSAINLETGAPVLLDRVHWNVKNDLAGRVINCTDYQWDSYRQEYYFEYSSTASHYYYPSSRTISSSFAVSSQLNNRSRAPITTQLMSVENGSLHGQRQVMAPSIERVQDSLGRDAIRIWQSDERYTLCTMGGEITVQGSILRAIPVTYGLSPTGTLNAENSASMCIDSDGDGWGWNGITSCLAQPITSSVSTLCTDTDGDGWGWDGSSSCTVETNTPAASTRCIDTDGDGWGWNGSESCMP